MTKLKNWTGGLCALLLSLQVNGSEINIQDAWIRPLTPGQEDAIAGMVINSTRQARVIAVLSPAYRFVAIQGPGKNGKNTRELEFIDLPAQKTVVLGADSVHLLLSGKQTPGTNDKVPIIFSVQFDDKTSKIITVMAQPVLSRGDAAQASTVVPPTAPPAETSKKAEVNTDTPPPQPVAPKAKASPVIAPKPPVAEVKPVKTAPVAVPKPAPAPVAARVVAAPLPAPVAPPAPVAAPAPVAIVAPSPVPLTVEPKKAPETKPAEQPKQVEAQASDECLNLAVALRECDKSNDMMLEWCVTSAKSKYSCNLSVEQLKKLKN